MSWVSNSSPQTSTITSSNQKSSIDGDIKMENADDDGRTALNGRGGGEREVDFDVVEAEEDFDVAS